MKKSEETGPVVNKADVNSLALDRTVLANERTYAAWIRTGLAALITGLGIARFMLEAMPLWSVRVISALFILFSAAAFMIAAWRYENLHVGVAHLDVKTIPIVLVKVLSILLAACSCLALIGMWYLAS